MKHPLPLATTLVAACAVLAPFGCGGSGGSSPDQADGSTGQEAGSTSSGSSSGSSGSSGSSSSGGSSGSSSGSSGGSSSGGSSSSSGGDGGPPAGDGAAPPGFWDNSNIPPAKNALMFKFLNRTNGKLMDSEVYWSFKSTALGVNELHSIAAQDTYDMPANGSGRMYFYLCSPTATSCAAGSDPTKSQYYDFIEFTIGATQFNGNTTRVDAFGVKVAMDLHCADGYDVAVGEDYATFAEDRSATFAKFLAEVPAEFQPLAQPPHAPYRIVEPGAAGFNTGQTYATYYDSFVDELWAANGLTIAKPGPNGSGLGSFPSVSAAIMRHVGATAGTFSPDGTLTNKQLWADSSTFYATAPADYYAKFWHTHGLNGKAYGFPYDDVGGYSSYISHANPQYILVAIGW